MLLCSAPVAKSVLADYLAPSKPKHKKRVKKEVCPNPGSVFRVEAWCGVSGSGPRVRGAALRVLTALRFAACPCPTLLRAQIRVLGLVSSH